MEFKNSFFNKVIFYKNIDSTNLEAKRLIKDNEIHKKTLIVSEIQTQGRGQYKRRWYSDNNKGIWATIIAEIDSENIFKYIMSVSVSIVQNIKDYDLKSYIKWPNDIEINKKKICGILCERKNKKLLIGFGININQDKKIFPQEIRDKTTSIFIEKNKQIDKFLFLKRLIEKLQLNWSNNTIYKDYILNCGIIDKKMILNHNEVTIKNITKDGSLIIEKKNKGLATIKSGTLKWKTQKQ